MDFDVVSLLSIFSFSFSFFFFSEKQTQTHTQTQGSDFNVVSLSFVCGLVSQKKESIIILHYLREYVVCSITCLTLLKVIMTFEWSGWFFSGVVMCRVKTLLK